MSRIIPTDGPLSDKDRAYLLMRGDDARVKWFDDTFPAVEELDEDDEDLDEEEDEEGEGDNYDELTVPVLQARIKELNAEGAEIAPVTQKKDDLIAALREYDARPDEV